MLRIILLAIAHFQNSPMKISISIGETIFWKNVCLEWIFTCCCSVTKSCPALCNPMNCSMPGFPALHYLPEFAQTHVHWVGDAIQPFSSSVVPFSCLQSFPASGSFPISRLFASGGPSIGASASILPMNSQWWSPLDWLAGSPCSPRDSQESFPTPQFKGINSLLLSCLYDPTLTFIHDYWKTIWTIWTFVGKVISLLFNTLCLL